MIYKLNGKSVSREEFLVGAPGFTPGQPPGGHLPACWPLVSSALGVGVDQVEAAMSHDRLHGVPTEYTKDGDAVITDRGHRDKLRKLLGFADK